MRFSVLLPTHDRADVVGFAIESVLHQTEPDFELLVVGDGCTDDTATVVASFDDPRIRWFDLPKGEGFGYANRNVALREARGELVGYLAHDDLLLDDHLERLAGAFGSPSVEWAYSRPLWIDDSGTMIPFATDLRRPDAFDRFMNTRNSIPASCVVHRRQCLEDYGYWPEDKARVGDWDLWQRMLRPAAGANLAYVPEPTCLHFRATWREGGSWGPPPLGEWLEMARSGWWPGELRRPVPQDATPQASIWAEMRADPRGWREGVRAASIDVIDGFAGGAGLDARRLADARERVAALEARVAEATARVRPLERQLAVRERQAQGLRKQLRVLTSSRSWRITAPMRVVGRTVRRIAAVLRTLDSGRRRRPAKSSRDR